MKDYRQYTRWEVVKDEDQFSWSDVVYDGHGYVELRDGSRLDLAATADLYREEREAWIKSHASQKKAPS